ncbi:uncharacterized protein LOC126184775 [Schistocerca cancellata]|uniref:uncharacterized protein LOC126184775 n=1 Tax=Schistocerca cancellata TaxID=274614 RepID=UPI0021180597|nr:uncharacterized protein LOC126184775 [Schistocerca cancellata]
MAGEDQNELIDFNTTYSDSGRAPGSISMKPLLPAPLTSFGICDYGANPFDQLMDLTNKNLSSKDDPFEMVFEKASGNIQPVTKNMEDIYSKITPSKCENISVLSSQVDITNMQSVKNYLNVSDDIYKFDRSGGLLTGTREEKVVNTAKLLDLPSPVFARSVNETVQCVEENKTSFTDFKHNSHSEHDESSGSSSQKTNDVVVHSEINVGAPVRSRRYSTSDIKVKAVIAERVKKCIQKALNDSRELFKSGSVTDLRCSEPKTELIGHRRSYSFSSVQKLGVQSPDNGVMQRSVMEIQSNSPWLRTGTSSGDILNTGFQNSRKSGSSRISRSFDDLYADINSLDAKISWKTPSTWKLKGFLIGKCGTATTCGVQPERLGHSLGEDGFEVKTEADDKSIFLDARSLSYVCEKAAEGTSPTNEPNTGSINDIEPPWEEQHNYEDVTFYEHDNAGQEQKECLDVPGCLRLKADDSKVFSDSNASLDSSAGLNPITHSTPVLRKDLLRPSALCSEAKISPLLPVVPVLGNSAVTVTQKLRPVRAPSQQEQKKGPLKAIVPVVSMTRTTKKGEAVADPRAGKISQNVTTHKAESVTTSSNDGKKPLRTESIKSSPYSQKKVNKPIASVIVKEDKKVQPIRRMVSVSSTQSPSASKSIKISTPSSDKGQKCLPRVDSGVRERSRSYGVKESPNQKPVRKPLQKSRSATNVPLPQSTAPRVLTEKNPDKKSPANIIQKTASNVTPKIQTPIRKIFTKLGRHIQLGKENQTP